MLLDTEVKGRVYSCDVVEMSGLENPAQPSDLARAYFLLQSMKRSPQVRALTANLFRAGFRPTLGNLHKSNLKAQFVDGHFEFEQTFIATGASDPFANPIYRLIIQGNYQRTNGRLQYTDAKMWREVPEIPLGIPFLERPPGLLSGDEVPNGKGSPPNGVGDLAPPRPPGYRGFLRSEEDDGLPKGRASTSGGNGSGK